MRYQNWDILLFPEKSQAPFQEFKTSCQVIQDTESHEIHANPLLLPTVTCFIPSVHARAPFYASIHCWENPEFSKYIQTLKKPSETTLFEARLLIDGNFIGSKWFDQFGPWPTVIDHSIELNKQGEFQRLKFPAFHKELLSQNYWNAGDDLGRIKVVISEGFSGDNYTFERIKNLICFSFQHAPLDVLEASSIAWPNAAMWRQVPMVGPYFAQHHSPQRTSDSLTIHSHSPRHGPHYRQKGPGSMPPPSAFPRAPGAPFDPFTDPAFTTYRSQCCSSDTSMPDYSAANTRASNSRHVTDPISISSKEGRSFETMGMEGAYESICEALIPSAPANTPQNGEVSPAILASVETPSIQIDMVQVINIEKTEGTSETGNIKGGKESLYDLPRETELDFAGNEGIFGKVATPSMVTSDIVSERQQAITPTSLKAIDNEDEPENSPSLRNISHTSARLEPDRQRRVLSGIVNV